MKTLSPNPKRSRRFRSAGCIVILSQSLFLSTAFAADPTSFIDDFEGPSLNPFWSLRQDNGSISFPSTARAHSGSQAVQFTSGTGYGQRNIELNHTFAVPQYGTVSVWVYDSGADLSSGYYLSFSVDNTNLHTGASIYTQDYDLGPSNGGNYYFYDTTLSGSTNAITSIDRTKAWHRCSITITRQRTILTVDGQTIYSAAGGSPFNLVRLDMHGPRFHPSFAAYYDDFSFVAAPQVDPASFCDDFEGPSLNPFWSLREDYGSIVFPSTDQFHSGNQAVRLTSGSGAGQRNVELNHTFNAPQYGTVTVWVYDGDSGHYTQLGLDNRASDTGAQIGTQDWELIGTGHYFFLNHTLTEDVNRPSSVVRTRGWHKWSISALPDATTFSIDEQVVYRGGGKNPFDFVRLDMHGPSSGAFDTYYDDFSFVSAAPKVNVRVAQVELCWDALSNVVYQIRYRDGFGTNAWLPLGEPILGTGAPFCTNYVVPRGQPQGFYQVILRETQ